MTIKQSFSVCVTCFFLLYTQVSFADKAECIIEITDFGKGINVYTIKHTFIFTKGASAQRKDFELPGNNDHFCTLTFWELKNGTMLSCEYKDDRGLTFFKSDRSILQDENADNHLAFRHKSAHFYIKTKCM